MGGERRGELKVLVVDASAHIRRLIATLLGALPVSEVIEARTPAQAIRLMDAEPDLVIIDWTADPTETLLFTHRIRRGESIRADTPILAMATSTHHAILERAEEAGIDDVIAKPISAMDVIHRSANLIETRRRANAFVKSAAAE